MSTFTVDSTINYADNTSALLLKHDFWYGNGVLPHCCIGSFLKWRMWVNLLPLMMWNSPQIRQVLLTHWNCCRSVQNVTRLALVLKNHVPPRLMGTRAYCKQILGSFHCYKAADLQPTTGSGSVPPSCSVLEPPITHTSWLMSHFPFLFPVLYNTELTVLQASHLC